MERIVDLDEAAAQISARRQLWTAAGLLVGPLTWIDETAAWPQPLEQDRSRVADPHSVGIRLTGPAGSELSVVLFRGGWADADLYAGFDAEIVCEAPAVGSPEEFGQLLDGYVHRTFGPGNPGASSASS
ncbi:hypothetical protein ACFVW8_19465 [Streptomyces sp. NPDC058221]|uniref:hypothetical protein n=1 Tax=Streptomyces sp. NPDC058221 TaxID=3346388 RepID=UPI0036EC754D